VVEEDLVLVAMMTTCGFGCCGNGEEAEDEPELLRFMMPRRRSFILVGISCVVFSLDILEKKKSNDDWSLAGAKRFCCRVDLAKSIILILIQMALLQYKKEMTLFLLQKDAEKGR
jgi:hypothetical protein